jgi:hypothetical protein
MIKTLNKQRIDILSVFMPDNEDSVLIDVAFGNVSAMSYQHHDAFRVYDAKLKIFFPNEASMLIPSFINDQRTTIDT